MRNIKEICLYNVQLPFEEGTRFQITVKNGIYDKVEKQQSAVSPSVVALSQIKGDLASYSAIDLEGKLLLPSFVDIHTHLDKAFSLKDVPNLSGTLQEAIANYSAKANQFTKQEIKQRVIRAALQSLSYGTTHIRTHVNFELDVSPKLALQHLQAVVEAKQELSPYLTIQIVPMFSNIYGRSKQEMDIIEEAIRSGVDGIGGAPHIFPDADKNIETLVNLAIKHDKFIDLHVDENDDPAICTIEKLIALTKEHQLHGRVTAGHLCSLAGMDEERVERIMKGMAEANVYAVTLPGANMYLQGRRDKGIVRRGITRVKELLEAGVSVAAASDNVNDPFHPFGRGDMVQIGLLTAYTAHLGSGKELQDVIRMMTTTPATIFGLKNHRVAENAPANFVIFDTDDSYDLFASLSPSRFVYTKGQWISERESHITFKDGKLSDLWSKNQQSELSNV